MTQEKLKTLINYDASSGAITLLVKTSNRQQVGEELHTKPYINLYGKSYGTLKLLAIYLYNSPTTKLITLDGSSCYRLANLFVVGSLTGKPLTQEILKTFLSYDKDTGIFKWISRYLPNTPIGQTAGNIQGTLPDAGYVQISLLGKIYPAHRLAWLYTYGIFPDKQLDHKDHNRTNNAIDNLREVTQHVNMKNKSMYYTNTSGYAGVELHGKNWKARIGVNGTKVLLGVFNTYEEAVAARKAGEKLLSYHENHGLLNV